MPITTSDPSASFVFYYNLKGTTDSSHDLYRSSNPWQSAKKVCDELHQKCPGVESVKSLDGSVFLITVCHQEAIETVARGVLNLVAIQTSPLRSGDRLVAAIPQNGVMVELVHTPGSDDITREYPTIPDSAD